jgi:hypothetical protein
VQLDKTDCPAQVVAEKSHFVVRAEFEDFETARPEIRVIIFYH